MVLEFYTNKESLNRLTPPSGELVKWVQSTVSRGMVTGAVAGLVGIECGVVSGVINLESSGVEASDWRLRHDEHYHEARFLAA